MHDPEMRHGHKSSRSPPWRLLELVEQSEANTGVPVEEAGVRRMRARVTHTTLPEADRTHGRYKMPRHALALCWNGPWFKTRFQLYLAATVANLTLVAGKLGWSGRTGGGATGRSVLLNIVPLVVAHAAANFCAVRLGQLWPVILLTSALLPKSPYPTGTFRPGF